MTLHPGISGIRGKDCFDGLLEEVQFHIDIFDLKSRHSIDRSIVKYCVSIGSKNIS